MPTAKVSAKGWVVIPAEYRRRHHIRPGDQVRVVEYGDVIAVVPQVREPEAAGYGMLKGKTSLTNALLRERRKDRRRESRK
jgi:AbrB family looped-hinge helix DNA binding protein